MGSRLLTSKKLGARISLATLTAQIALGSLTLGLSPTAAFAADVFTENFGTGGSVNDIPSWDEQGNDDDGINDVTTAQAASSGDDEASPNGGRFAKIGQDEWICRTFNTSLFTGYSNPALKFYWHGDDDAESSDDGIVEYRNGSSCTGGGSWTNGATYDLNNNTDSWSTLQSVSLPTGSFGSQFTVRFRQSSDAINEYFRVDGVVLTGDVVLAATTTTITNVATLSSTPTVVGEAVTVQWSVTESAPGTPTGTVSVTVDGNPGCSAAVGVGQCLYTPTAPGTDALVATYSGDANFATSASASTNHTVNKADTTTTITNDVALATASTVGSAYAVDWSVTVTAPGAGAPTGTVTVSDGTDTCNASVGTGTCNLTSTTAGAKTITATYAGDANFNTSNDTASHTVDLVADCGNGIIEGAEQCDDGSEVDGDGCSMSCEVESGWTCDSEPSVCTELPPVEMCNGQVVTISGAGTINGTSGNDVIMGSADADQINGGAGDDIICAGDGHDEIVGGDDDDTIFGEGGNDSLLGGDDNDDLDGGNGIDYCRGESGFDTETNCEANGNNRGIIVIEKDAQPDAAQDFAFSGYRNLLPWLVTNFTLDDDTDGMYSNVFYSEQLAGQFTVTEDTTSGWTLESITCNDPGGTTATNVGTRTASIDLDEAEVITCLFVNVEDEEGVDTTPPAVPTHLSPADNSAHTSAALTMSDWTDVTDPSSPITYYYQSSHGTGTLLDGSFADPVYTSGALSTSEIAHGGTPEGTYYWHVRAVDSAGNSSPWTSYWTLVVDNTPDPVCGNETEEVGEQCDDGNVLDGDGCSATCQDQPLACTTADGDISFYLPFDETSGTTANDASLGGSMDGAHVNGPVISADVPALGFYNGRSLEFDGADDYVDLGNGSFSTPASFSVSAWVKADTIGIDRQIVSKGYNGTQTEWEMKTTSVDGKVSIQTYNAAQIGVQSLTSLAEDAWTHVVGTFDGTTWKIYLNGSLDNSNVGAAPIATTRSIHVGAVDNQGTPVQFWDGNIDEVRFYGRALTQDEVSDLFGGACAAVDTPPSAVCGNEIEEEGEQCDDGNDVNGDGCSNMCQDELEACVTTDDYLVAHWEFDAGTGSVAYDATDVNNEGAVTGASWIAGVLTAFYNPFALSFDGSDDIVTVSNTADLDFGTNDAFTISAWTKAPSFSGYETILQKIDDSTGAQQGFVLTLANGVPQFWMQSNYAANEYLQVGSTTPLTANAWHHVAVTYDGSGLASGVRIYLDGVDTTGAVGHDNLVGSITNVGEVEIGNRNGGSFQQLSGDVDDVRVYEKALNLTQIAALAAGSCDAGVTAPPPALDTDFDDVPDSIDNCDLVVNTNQVDTDGDQIGDACDETPNGNEGGNEGNGNQSFGLSTPDVRGDQGARRGSQTNILRSLIGLFGGNGEQGDVPPGGFGGPGEEEFTDEEAEVICRMRKALPADASSSVRTWVAEQLAAKMPHSVEAIAAELKDGTICPQVVTRVKVTAPITFRVDAAGFPVSSNDTWNKCIRGTATLEDIRNNPDRDEDGYGVSCSRYRTASVWRHPDLDMYFTWNGPSRGVTLPAGYALKQDDVVTQR